MVEEQPSFRDEAAGGAVEVHGAAEDTDDNSPGASLKQLHGIADDDIAMPSSSASMIIADTKLSIVAI